LAWKEKEAFPLRFVVTLIWPRNTLPSSKLRGSAWGLAKNWMVKILFLRPLLGVLSSVPPMTVLSLEPFSAEAISGKFCSPGWPPPG
jgi:hypothetical protein